MSELKVCRICLNKDVKLFKLEHCNLKQYYEQIMRSKVPSKGELPRYFCFECAALLYKYHKFKEKCDYGQSTLKKLACNGFLTHYVIEDVRKNRSDLQPTADYINYLSSKRIKTINIKYKTDVEPLEIENVIINSLADEEYIQYKRNIQYEYIPESNHDNNLNDTMKCEIDANLATTTLFKTTTELEVPYTGFNNLDTKFLDVEKSFNTEPVLKEESTTKDETESILNDLLFASDKDDSSNDASFSIDMNITNDRDKKPIKRTRRTAKKKEDTKVVKDQDPDASHKFVGIIREPKGELSKGNWETKLLTDEEAMEQFKKKEFESKYERMEFKCTKCFKGFSKNDMLLRHNKMWHEKGDNECRFCHMQFKWKSKLQVHMMKHYYIYKCLRCSLQFYLKNGAVFHDGHHNGVIHKCKHCGEEYTHISTYYTHLRTSHRNAHACKICGATFVSQTGVVVHMKRKHVIPSSEEPSTNIYCQKCDISFVSQSAYDEHLSQSKLHEEENKDIKRTRRRRREILANAARCIHCNKKFKSKTEVKMHIVEEHPGQNKVERVVCEICGAVLSSAYIDIHMNRHTRKKLYPCQTCGKEFLCVTSHNTHQLTHSGEKPHPCPICPKRFGLKGHMEVHYKRVHLKEPYPKRTYNRKNRNRQPTEVPLYASLPK